MQLDILESPGGTCPFVNEKGYVCKRRFPSANGQDKYEFVFLFPEIATHLISTMSLFQISMDFAGTKSKQAFWVLIDVESITGVLQQRFDR